MLRLQLSLASAKPTPPVAGLGWAGHPPTAEPPALSQANTVAVVVCVWGKEGGVGGRTSTNQRRSESASVIVLLLVSNLIVCLLEENLLYSKAR